MEEPTVVGEWRRVSQLGAGGFGIVTLWRNGTTNDTIAIKKCKMSLPSSLTSRQRDRWEHEVKIMKEIKNRNIVSFKELPDILHRELNKYNPTKLPLLSMEYCSQGNLRTYIKSWENRRGVSEIEVRYILSDVCNAIECLHSMNITHRDIKPENIVMQSCDERPNKIIYKIIDLGYAKELNSTISFVGTLPYLAPEIFKTENYTKNVDYWSFGITVFEIITGYLPFLPTLEPMRRFEYIKRKSEEHICIYSENTSKNGIKIKYSKEIMTKIRISTVLKKNIERWLRLVLQFDSAKRGTFQNISVDVISELKDILAKRIVKVVFVYNLTTYSYEITESTTFGDLKKLVLSQEFSLKNLVVLHKNQDDLYSDSDRILECIENVDYGSEFYIYCQKVYMDVTKSISFPTTLEQLHKSRSDFTTSELKELTMKLIFFIRTEKESLESFNKAIYAQISIVERMFESFLSKKLLDKIRNDVTLLIAKIECYNVVNTDILRNDFDNKHQFLNSYRKLLRQTKELIENVNGMTEKFLQFLNKREQLEPKIKTVKTALERNNFDSNLNSAISLYTRLQKCMETNSSSEEFLQNSRDQAPIHLELAKILSQVVRIWRTNVITNTDIKDLILLLLNLPRSIKKHYIWCMALDRELYRVTKELHDNQQLISQHILGLQTSNYNSLTSISFPNNLSVELLEGSALMQENMELRLAILDKLDEGSLSLQKIQCEVLKLYNGVSMRCSDI